MDGHTGGGGREGVFASSAYRTCMAHAELSHAPSVQQRERNNLTHFTFEKRSKTARSRCLALLRETSGEPAPRSFNSSFAPLSKHHERFVRQYRHEPPPSSLLTLPFSRCVHHLSTPNTCLTQTPLSRSRTKIEFESANQFQNLPKSFESILARIV